MMAAFIVAICGTVKQAVPLAAISVRHVGKRWSGFGAFARRAPYVSCALVLTVGLFTGYQGWIGLR